MEKPGRVFDLFPALVFRKVPETSYLTLNPFRR
jgi:hypothetical protein